MLGGASEEGAPSCVEVPWDHNTGCPSPDSGYMACLCHMPHALLGIVHRGEHEIPLV